MLSELSSLVKSAKRLQECQRGTLNPAEDVNDIVDEMILKAFKIVTKGVRFLDILDDDRRARAPTAVTVMATVMEESYIPPTPPADRAGFNDHSHHPTTDTASRTITNNASLTSGETVEAAQESRNKRHSSLASNAGANPNRTSQGSLPPTQRLSQSGVPQANRLSANMAHRVSLAGPSPLSRPHHLISERLNRSHDKFLSHLGSFIGRLHLQSQSRHELALAIKQSATSGGELLAVIDAVYSHSSSTPTAFDLARNGMLERIQALVFSARDTLSNAAIEGADVIMPQDNSILLQCATACVRAAGECVAKTKSAIERSGDFEYELEENALDMDLSILDVSGERSRTPSVTGRSEAVSVAESAQTCDSYISSIRRPSVAVNKTLPPVPHVEPDVGVTTIAVDADTSLYDQNRQPYSPTTSRPTSLNDDNTSSVSSSISSVRPTLPPLPKLTTTLLSNDLPILSDHSIHESDFHPSRFDSLTGSSAGSSATFLSRDSEVSVVSQTSTRATTPDHTLVPRNQPSISELSTAGSSTHTEEGDDVESRLLVKTYAHELIFNKEGQVTGGSLPALIERLTTHEATPDATFVSTFYLTFRLFCTPVKLTEALIDRFEYVGESPHMAGPVRLRVYNAFKGWLESHWREHTDRDALDILMPFAEHRLSSVLPSASRRLLELAHRVSGQGSLVPRFVSSMGKSNTALGQYIPAEVPLPAPLITKSQQNALIAFKIGGVSPTILDFEPLELARQLTIRQMSIFCSILPEELLSSQWMKKGGVDAPNVKAMTALSTDLSNLVADTILQHSEIKKRAAVVKQWIKIAQRCLELHNYDGVMAIICSLNSSTISRLRKTWDAVPPKRRETLRNLQEIVEPSQNNKVLRTRLNDHVPPCLPFLGMYLTDLTFVDIGNPATKQMALGGESEEISTGGLTVVNFDKHARTAKIIGELQRFQIPYRLTELSEMQDWMSEQIKRVREGDQGNVQVTYYRKSLLLEPRETATRREGEPINPPAAVTTAARGDLFGWISRDRNGQAGTPAPI